MKQNKKKVKIKNLKTDINNFLTTIISFMIPIFQYIPCASIWFGIMSLPLITYFTYFLSNPQMIRYDFQFFSSYGLPWSIISILGGLMFISSLIYQLIHRKELIKKGPYKYVRHPQYLGIIIMTLGLTMISLNTSPVFPFLNEFTNNHSLLVLIWFIEVIAYVILAKIEDFALKAKYGDEFLDYIKNVPFLFPSIKLKRN
ncbi:MAG: methyltransferase family protein [Promethearchaeota archaeon]